MNNTVELLDNVKEKLRKTFKKRYFENEIIDSEEWISNQDFRGSIIIIKKVANEKNEEVPYLLQRSRTVEEFLEGVFHSTNNKQEMIDSISYAYNPYISYLEENMYEVEIVKVEVGIPAELTYTSITDALNNCETRINNGDYSGAITSAKTLVEGVCKEILLLKGIDVKNDNDNLPKLYNDLSKHLTLNSDNPKVGNSLKEITSGLNKVIKGLAEVRNSSGDSHAKRLTPTFHHAVLAVNAAKTVTSFLFHTYEYQKEKGGIKINS